MRPSIRGRRGVEVRARMSCGVREECVLPPCALASKLRHHAKIAVEAAEGFGSTQRRRHLSLQRRFGMVARLTCGLRHCRKSLRRHAAAIAVACGCERCTCCSEKQRASSRSCPQRENNHFAARANCSPQNSRLSSSFEYAMVPHSADRGPRSVTALPRGLPV